MSACPARSTALCSLTRREADEVNPSISERYEPQNPAMTAEPLSASQKASDIDVAICCWREGRVCAGYVGGKLSLFEILCLSLRETIFYQYSTHIIRGLLKGNCRVKGNRVGWWQIYINGYLSSVVLNGPNFICCCESRREQSKSSRNLEKRCVP